MSEITILAKNGANKRLDKFLSDYLIESSRTVVKKMISDGMVYVDGEKAKPSLILKGTEKISYTILDREKKLKNIEPEDIDLEILFEDDAIIAINKSAGITVHPGAGQRNGTLVNGLVSHFKKLSNLNGNLRPGIVHRLDKDTSGVIIIAKSNDVHSNLSEQFEKRSVSKEYFAIVWGKYESDEGEIHSSIARSKKDPTSYIVDPNGKEAFTGYASKPLGIYNSEVIFKPKTGRTHQIRVHTSSLGNPIFGDEKYGGGINKSKGFIPEVSKKLNASMNQLGRHALHARKIIFNHPINKKSIAISAKIPNEINELRTQITNLNA